MIATHDAPQSARARRREAERFAQAHRAEAAYAVLLRRIARHVDQIIKTMARFENETWLRDLEEALLRYAEAIEPWARAAAQAMLADVARRDAGAWARFSSALGLDLRREVQSAPLGQVMRRRLDDQVELIKSLPREAAQRVRNLATTGYVAGARVGEIRSVAPSALVASSAPEGLVREVLRTGEVTVSRANLIARTEVTRTATELTRARAEHVGSTGYVWRTALDRDVRAAHKHLEGTFHRWDEPPVAEADGKRHHPGEFPNCFTGETIVSLSRGCRGLFRAFYEGDLVRLVVDSEIIEVTPNHPILTERGWVKAGLLDKGDYVIIDRFEDENGSKRDVNESKTRFVDLFEALCRRDAKRTQFSALNFHGDFIVNDDIYHITVDKNLLFDLQVGLFQPSDQLELAWADGSAKLTNLSGIFQVLETFFSGFSDAIFMILSGLGFRDQLVSFFLPAYANAVDSEQVIYESWRASVALREYGRSDSTFIQWDDLVHRKLVEIVRKTSFSLSDLGIYSQGSQSAREEVGMVPDRASGFFNGGSSSYERCRVVDKSLRKFSGHVYTMETETGDYTVGAVRMVSKNCRCWPEPVLPRHI